MSDRHLTENSFLLDKLLPSDLILAARGFDITESVGVKCPCTEVKYHLSLKGKCSCHRQMLKQPEKSPMLEYMWKE